MLCVVGWARCHRMAGDKGMCLNEYLPRVVRRERGLTDLILIGLLAKISVLAIIPLAYHLMPFCVPCYYGNFVYPAATPVTPASAFKTWDGQHYIFLAEQWYGPGRASNAFYPLYPLAVRLFRFIFLKNTLVTGLVLSNLFAMGALILLYLLAREIFDERTGFYAGLLFLAFPTSYYSGLVYTESLFLLLALLLFYGLYRNRFLPALTASFLLPLARPQGVLLLVPLLIYLWVKIPATKSLHFDRRHVLPFALLAGFASYLGIMKAATGDPFAGFAAQNSFISGNAIGNLIHPLRWFQTNFLTMPPGFPGPTMFLLDRAFFVGFLLVLVLIHRYLDKVLFACAAVLGLVVVFSGLFIAYSRFLLVVFPIFIVLGHRLKDRHYLVTIPSMFLQISFLVAHSLNYWIA